MTLAPAREVDAARLLYERYANRILGFCLQQPESPADAEDAAQTTLLNAFRALQRDVVPTLEAAWLFAIARNVCHERRRAARRRSRVETATAGALTW